MWSHVVPASTMNAIVSHGRVVLVLEVWQEKQLRDLAWHWDTVYDIAVVDGTWTAKFTGPGQSEPLTGGSARELRKLIRADYARRKSAASTGWRM